MSDHVGGCLFFEPEQTRKALISATLQAMGLRSGTFRVGLPDEDGFPRFAGEGYPALTEAKHEQTLTALARLAQLESGIIEAEGTDQYETFWFEPRAGSYPVMTIWVPDSAMYDDDRPEYSEAFIPRWVELCEQGKAVLGYFSPFEHMFDRDYVEERLQPALESGDLKQILEVSDACWLVYLGPELAQRWRQEQTTLPFSVQVSQELPSGAHFFRTRTGVNF